ncbi:MAG: tyrosine-type recombinase/integrase [Filomicrobium sp.]
MPGRKARISRKSIAALEPGDWITDDTLPGFRARRTNRLASYILSIRLNGRMRWITLGNEAELTPEQARAEAERLRGLKRQGVDPARERDRRKSAVLIRDALDLFLREHVSTKLKPRTATHYREVIERALKPEFGDCRINSVTNLDVSQWHASLSKTPTSGNRSLAILSSFFSWALARKLAGSNPCAQVRPYRERKVIRYPTPEDLRALLAACDELVDEGRLNPFFAAGIRVLALTGARRSEVFEAQWHQYDKRRSALVLRDPKGRETVLALPPDAATILNELPRFSNIPFIFPSLKTRGPFVNFSAQWAKVIKRADVGRWRIHDLRHGFASTAVSSGASLAVIQRQLGHSRPATTARYAHVGDTEKHSVAATVADLLGGDDRDAA